MAIGFGSAKPRPIELRMGVDIAVALRCDETSFYVASFRG
jgi:hypothetical protein